MMLSRLKVGTRLVLGFGVVLAILVSVATVGVVELGVLDGAMVSNVDFGTAESNLVAQSLNDAQDASIAMRDLIIVNDTTKMNQQKATYERKMHDYVLHANQVRELFKLDPKADQKERDFLLKIDQSREAAVPLANRAVQLGFADNPAGPYFMTSQAGPAIDRWTGELSQFLGYEAQRGVENARTAHATYRVARMVMLALTAIALLVALCVGLIIMRGLQRQLGGEPDDAVTLVERIADGELTVDLPLRAGDDWSLLYSMNVMRERLLSAVTGIHLATDQIVTVSRDIAKGNNDLSLRTSKQAASLEDTAASMSELTQTVRHSADNARQANLLASRASEAADAGNAAVQEMLGTIDRIRHSASKISEIISMIEGIAFQTNILALNAAVEAARAGAHGKGFAVVASEVRSLAQRSAAAAREIKDLITSSVATIRVGADQASGVGASVADVRQSIRKVSDMVGEISAASEEQSRGIERVNLAVTQMDGVTQQNAALVYQVTDAAKSLEAQAGTLRDTLSRFRIHSDDSLLYVA